MFSLVQYIYKLFHLIYKVLNHRLLQALQLKGLEWVSWNNGMNCTEKGVQGSSSNCPTSYELTGAAKCIFNGTVWEHFLSLSDNIWLHSLGTKL